MKIVFGYQILAVRSSKTEYMKNNICTKPFTREEINHKLLLCSRLVYPYVKGKHDLEI